MAFMDEFSVSNSSGAREPQLKNIVNALRFSALHQYSMADLLGFDHGMGSASLIPGGQHGTVEEKVGGGLV